MILVDKSHIPIFLLLTHLHHHRVFCKCYPSSIPCEYQMLLFSSIPLDENDSLDSYFTDCVSYFLLDTQSDMVLKQEQAKCAMYSVQHEKSLNCLMMLIWSYIN